MSTERLFDDDAASVPATAGAPTSPSGAPRLLTANRTQVELRLFDPESLLPADHEARAIWALVEKLDLSEFYAGILACGSEPGRSALDPKVLLCLWLYATSQGLGSARELSRLCKEHHAYRWICGGLTPNYHKLSDFRVGQQAALDALMTQILAVLLRQKLVRLKRTAHDGMRVRASAGAASFRRKKSLDEHLEAARQQVEAVKNLADDPSVTARERAAQERAAQERQARIERALEELPKAQAAKKSHHKKKAKSTAKPAVQASTSDETRPAPTVETPASEASLSVAAAVPAAAAEPPKPVESGDEARVSTTDHEARVMKMGDGGFRPAYNVQLATDTESRFIVGVSVTNVGSDGAQLTPMLGEIRRRAGKLPSEHLVDGGFVNGKAIEKASQDGVTVYAPVPAPRKEGVDRYAPKADDSPEVAAWRERMGTALAKTIYKERAATAETVNADLRMWRGLDRFVVRGLAKVTSIALWSAITYNMLRWIAVTA